MNNISIFPKLSANHIQYTLVNRISHLFDVAKEGLFYMNDAQEIFFYNAEFYKIFGIKGDSVPLEVWLRLVHPLDREMITERIKNDIKTTNSRMTEQYRVKKCDGQYAWLEVNIMVNSTAEDFFLVGSHSDISDKKLMESYIQRVEFHDNTSGLYNHNKLLLDISDILAAPNKGYSLLYLQIEEIQSYINSYGRDIVGDLTQHVIDALHCIPSQIADFYRVREDDFAAIIRADFTEIELLHLCQRIKQKYQETLTEHGHLFGTQISIGVYPNFGRASNAEDIVHKCARTCQFAKDKNQNRVAAYSEKTQCAVDRYFFIEKGLKNALENHSLSVKFQPIISAQGENVSSFETLVRWRSKEFGEIYPDEFIPVAEKKGFITELGYQVFAKACQFIKTYNYIHKRNTHVNVNVSVLQLMKSDFPHQVKQMADDAGVPTSSIILELTETLILDSNQAALSQLQILSDYGFKLSLDDFGSGYSSLNSFFDLPLNQIKIDKILAWKTMDNRASSDYLTFLIKLCRSNGVDIVIEGVENAQMYSKFKEMGATYLQGYWFSKPLSVASASRYTL